MHRNIPLLLLVAALTVACKPQAAPAAPSAAPSTPVAAPAASAPAPGAAQVMRDIFRADAADAQSQTRLPDGRYASVWQGHAFALDGTRYYVGLSEYTDASENEYPAESDTVSLAQATYALEAGAWRLLGANEGVGRFGAFNKPPQVDEASQAQGTAIDGRYFVGIPTVETAAAGARLTFYELFAFSPKDVRWTYLGYVPGGRDTRAGCTADAGVPQPVVCVASQATLRFAPSGADWPSLTVAIDGEVVGDDGKARRADARDAVEYRFDPASSTYLKADQ
ncbi:MAG TPA: hypothetical protein VGE64_05000 [Xanthomonadaceae bacterium]